MFSFSYSVKVFAVDWSPDGEKVTSAGRDRVLKLWIECGLLEQSRF